jgi:uncharacterized membrane protein YgcG
MKLRSFRPLVAGAVFLAASAMTVLPASAVQFIQDGAGMFSASTVAQLDERLSAFNSQTGKEIVVVTTPSLNGATLQSAADSAFNQQSINGVLIYIARDDRRDMIVPDRAGVQAGWFAQDVLANIRATMESQFKAEDYDGGIASAVNSLLQIYRAHLGSLQQSRSGYVAGQNQPVSRGVHLSMFWWIIILVVGFLIVRSIMRVATMARYSNMPPPGGAPPPGGYGPGYGPGYGYGGYGGGGGSFWSGLLGGLGGAWLGNELFRGGGGIGGLGSGTADSGNAPDASGWQSDPGQAGAGSGGDWSGGGFGSDFGGGDSGGGGDFGGGGGDSGGGW